MNGTSGGLVARVAGNLAEREMALGLRAQAFRRDGGDDDRDEFDDRFDHVLIGDRHAPRACFRYRVWPDGAAAVQGYAGSHYDLTRLIGRPGPMIEIGRLCVDSAARGTELPRMTIAALTRLALTHRARFLFGCASFAGTDPAPHRGAFALLAARHQAPEAWRPGQGADRVHDLRLAPYDPVRAATGLPPPLRAWLALGAQVSDHAVVDEYLGALHVFAGLDVACIPRARAGNLLRLARLVPALDGLTGAS